MLQNLTIGYAPEKKAEYMTDMITENLELDSLQQQNLSALSVTVLDMMNEVRSSRDDHMALIQRILSDHGAGMSKADLSHITEPFYRADTARQRGTGGYGLGLYLCNFIVEAPWGKLDIQSRLGEGTEVTVYFPIEKNTRQN